MSALSTTLTRGARAATASTARLTTAIVSSHSPSMMVNMASVWFGSPLSRTTRTASATTSPTASPVPRGVTENATSTARSSPRPTTLTLPRREPVPFPPPPGLHGLEPGARVVGVGIGCGAFAEYTVLPAAAVMPVPAGWAAEEALGLVVNWPTALAALRPLGRIAAGQTVLIHAAAGGTGQVAVTMAKHYGATVIATASV